jgi:hypothetical protein
MLAGCDQVSQPSRLASSPIVLLLVVVLIDLWSLLVKSGVQGEKTCERTHQRRVLFTCREIEGDNENEDENDWGRGQPGTVGLIGQSQDLCLRRRTQPGR